MSGAPGSAAGAMSAYDRRQAILDASPKWRFRIAVDRFERAIRNAEAHIREHGSAPMPDALWAEEKVARRELMAFDPADPRSPARPAPGREDGENR